MKVNSTRNNNVILEASEAVVQGLAPDGGLFIPRKESLSGKIETKTLLSKNYNENAETLFNLVFDDLGSETIKKIVNSAYNDKTFNKTKKCLNPENIVAPLSEIGDDYLMELYHGRTSAFKDVALSLLPYLMNKSYEKLNASKKIYILTATSGDTGKAALEAFSNVENTYITVFYPKDGVSEIQKLQMTSQEGENVSVYGIDGNFDSCQKLVKEIYGNKDFKNIAEENNVILSSANSINIGRLIPQVVYYETAYADLVNAGKIKLGEKINFCVPSANFGDIFGGYLAKILGLPINKLILANNCNNVLCDFVKSGIYDSNRQLYVTTSPSIDILVSSNLERLLYYLSNEDSEYITKLMNELKSTGKYEVNNSIKNKLLEEFDGYTTNEQDVINCIKECFDTTGRLIDTHTAVAYNGLKQYKTAHPEDFSKNVILATASPYKFAKSIIKSFGESAKDDFEAMKILYKISGDEIPKNLSSIKEKSVRFKEALKYEEAKDIVAETIKQM